jgi:hypothetical protein
VPYNRKSKKNLCPPWKPGQSGNPEGKAPGTYGYRRRIMAEIDAAYEADKLLNTQEPTPKEPTQAEEARPELRIPCAVCRHSGRAVIDGLLTLGISLRAIARSYGFSKSALHRHKCRHLPVFPNAERAIQIKPIDEGLNQILNSWDGMQLSGPRDGAQRALERLWKLNHETAIKDDPLDQLRILTIEAFTRLLPILWRERRPFEYQKEYKQDMKNYVAGIETLKAWGRDAETRKDGG